MPEAVYQEYTDFVVVSYLTILHTYTINQYYSNNIFMSHSSLSLNENTLVMYTPTLTIESNTFHFL